MFAAPRKYSAWQMDKAIKRNSGERKKFVGVLCLFDFGRILKDFFKRVKTALRCRVRFSRYVLWLWANWIKITLFFWAIGPAARRQGGSAVFWKVIPDFFWIYKSKTQYNFIIFTKKSQEKNSGFSKIIWKFLIFVKIFPPKNQKETSVGQILSVLSDEISKWRNLSDYRTMRYLFFARTAFFRRGVFPHARVRACGHMRARTHLCNACAFIMGARRTEFQLSAFYDCFAELFIRRAPKKQNYGIFGGIQCRSLQNPVKNVKFGLKRLGNGFLRRWKGDIRQKKL